MSQNINFDRILSGIADIASSIASNTQAVENEAPLFDEQTSDLASGVAEFVSVLGDVSSTDSTQQSSIINMIGSVANIMSAVSGGSDAVTVNDANNIGSVVKNLAENFAGRLIDESPLSDIGNKEFSSVVEKTLASNLQSLALEGNINIMGVNISAGGLLNFGINAFSNTVNASSNVLSSVISGSINLLSGNKTIDDTVSDIIKTIQSETKALNEKNDEGLDKLADESGYDREEVQEKIGDFIKNSVGTFVTSFISNGIKTALTNPASLSNPAVFLTSTLAATVTSKSFQTKMLSNVSSLITGQEQNPDNASLKNELNFMDFAKMILKSENMQNVIRSLV